jgi:hypothetical protein
MPEYAVNVKLTATVRVRAADEMVARKAATSLLLSLTADDIRIPTANDAALRGDATVTEASFSVEGRPYWTSCGSSRLMRLRSCGPLFVRSSGIASSFI